MNLFLSLMWALCLPLSVLAKRSAFSYGVIIEYEDWATEDNIALIESCRSTLINHSLVDEVDVTPRLKISSSIFRGISANISGFGSDVTTNLIESRIQTIRAVKRASPIAALYIPSPIGSTPRSFPGSRSNPASSNAGSQVVASQESTGYSPHVQTGVDRLHAAGIKGKGVTIAIMDNGYDYRQAALGNSIGPGQKVVYGYDWVGDTYDLAGGIPAIEDDDPFADCNDLHGTHIFGIVAANPTDFGVIKERGVDIITVSLGSGSGYPDDPWSTVIQRINNNGTYFQSAIGNNGPGLYTGVLPSTGIDVPAIGAVFNTETPFYQWNGSYTSANGTTALTWILGDQVAFPPTFSLWTASAVESDILNEGCGPYPSGLALPDFNTTVVLLSQSFVSPCFAFLAQEHLASLGARYILFYNPQADDPVNGPLFHEVSENILAVGHLPGAVGMALFAAYQSDRSLTVSLGNFATVTVQKNDITGGRIAAYSAWGPTLDGRTYPTFTAPGSHILSTFPRRLGGIGSFSGTSMSTPFAAGVAALLKQQHPDWDAATIRNVLATTGNPMPYNDNSSKVYDFLAPVFQQGGGLLDAFRAAYTTTVIDVPSLSFNDTANRPRSLSFKVRNIGSTAQTFRLSHIGAASGLGISSRDEYTLAKDETRELSNDLVAAYATLEITPSEVTIAAGQESTITVSVTQEPDLDRRRLPFYGGYIALNSTDGTQNLTVPYTGIATSLYDLPIDTTGSVLASYSAATNVATAVPDPGPDATVFNITYLGPSSRWAEGPWPGLLTDIRSSVRFHKYKYDLVTGAGDLLLELANFTNLYQPGNHWYLDGTDGGNAFFPEENDYRFRVSVLKIYGDETRDEDWASTVSQPFRIRYTEDSVGLPGSPNATTPRRRWEQEGYRG